MASTGSEDKSCYSLVSREFFKYECKHKPRIYASLSGAGHLEAVGAERKPWMAMAASFLKYIASVSVLLLKHVLISEVWSECMAAQTCARS